MKDMQDLSVDHRNIIKSAQSCDLLLRTITEHLDNNHFQKASIIINNVKFAHWMCSTLNSMTDDKENVTTLGSVGSCEFMVEILKEHKGNAQIVKELLPSIQVMALNAENRIRLGNAGGCNLLLIVLREHKSD
jgi:hypothetical protein